MQTECEVLSQTALRLAQGYLAHTDDPCPTVACEDIAQEAALVVLRDGGRLKQGASLPGYVRTITWRLAHRARRQRVRRRVHSGHEPALEDLPEPASVEAAATVRVGAQEVPVDWCLHELQSVFVRVGALNRELLKGFYAGSSCAELAACHGLTPPAVKVRLYRSRLVIQAELERRVHARSRHGGRQRPAESPSPKRLTVKEKP